MQPLQGSKKLAGSQRISKGCPQPIGASVLDVVTVVLVKTKPNSSPQHSFVVVHEMQLSQSEVTELSLAPTMMSTAAVPSADSQTHMSEKKSIKHL